MSRIQPMILPLFGGLSDLDLLWMMAGKPKVEGPQLVQDTFRETAPPGDFDTAWNKFLHDGFASHVQVTNREPKFNGNSAGGVAHTLWNSDLPPPTKDSPEIVLIGATRWTTAVTSTTAGSRKCPTRSPN
jgi:molybdopterin-containing oxidoreductase family iron-sulfur binding subunit